MLAYSWHQNRDSREMMTYDRRCFRLRFGQRDDERDAASAKEGRFAIIPVYGATANLRPASRSLTQKETAQTLRRLPCNVDGEGRKAAGKALQKGVSPAGGEGRGMGF